MASCREFAESAVEAGWGAIILNGGVQAFAMARVMIHFGVSAVAADATSFVIGRSGAGVSVVGQ